MTTPIKPAAPHPGHRPTPAARAPQAENRLSSPALQRRSDTERSRQTGSAFGTSRDSGEMTADGLFFEQLLVPSATDQGEQSEQHGGSGFSLFQAAGAIPTQLIDELAMQLPARGDRPFSATLLMPNLGKVQVRAGKRDNQWTIDLGFERADVLSRLRNNREACEDAFSQALGQDVSLSLHGTQAT